MFLRAAVQPCKSRSRRRRRRVEDASGFRRDRKKGGIESGKGGGELIGWEGRGGGGGRGRGRVVTPRRRVQRRGNERLPALHHAQGLPQSAGGRGEMPHVSGLLALPPSLYAFGIVCVHERASVSERERER